MCMGGAPQMPEMPEPPKPMPPAPAPPPPEAPADPLPPPEIVNKGEGASRVKAAKSKRQQAQQLGQGASSLRIPLNTGSAQGAKAGGSLNIPS